MPLPTLLAYTVYKLENIMSIETQVLVIGAGISGLKAASDLCEQGIDTVVLEARNRIGGRIHTERNTPTGNYYDLGATWFHSTMENPVFEKFINEWFEPQFAKYDDSKVGFVLDTPSGGFPNGVNFGPIVDELKYFFSNLGEDTTLQNAVVEYLKTKKTLVSQDESKYAAAVIRFAELLGGGQWDMISAKYSWGPFNGRDAFNTLGYDSVLGKLVEKIPQDKIILNAVVSTVEKIQSSDSIKVTTKEGKTYTCRYLVVTLPLGVLKMSNIDPTVEGAIKFIPELPENITRNFSKTHFAPISKVIVEYEKAFWPDNEKFLVLQVPNNDDLDLIKTYTATTYGDFSTKPKSKAFEFPCLVSNFDAVRGVPALMFLLPAQPTKELESSENPQEFGYQLVAPIIKKITGLEELPKPKFVLTTNWGTDPYSRGAITTCAPGDLFVNDALIEGFGNIRFAGEGTIAQGRACAHGAYLSGEREASYIIKHINQ